MKIKKLLLLMTALALMAVIGLSAYQLQNINRNYAQEAQMHSRVLRLRPTLRVDPAAPNENREILDLQAEFSDVVGWLSIPNTRIDYPFVQGKDNDFYLHLDLDQNWAAAGTIFMDYRNNPDFSDFNTILFGHHMQNGSMFGTLQNFDNPAFFDANRSGTMVLADKTYEITFFAFAVLTPDDPLIYNPKIETEADALAFLDHVKHIARYYRDVGATAESRIITLSTCNFEFHDARMVLIGKLSEI